MKYGKRIKKNRTFRKRIFIVITATIVACSFVFAIKNIFFSPNKLNDNFHARNKTIDNNVQNKKSDTNLSDNNMDIRENDSHIGINMDNNISNLGGNNQKTAYLTFDDGPSSNVTPRILDILDKYNIKATFFVIGKQANANKGILIREQTEGNAIGDHTFTHDYKYVYENPKNLVDDFRKCENTLDSILGPSYKVKYVRFPGGSFGSNRKPFREAVLKAGYSFVDWNSLNGDAEGNNIPPSRLVENLKRTSKGKKTLVILMHDAPAKQTTVQALPQIIDFLKSEGYIFKTLS